MTQNLSGFDPVELLLKRKKQRDDLENGELPEVEPYKDEDVKSLEDFCKKHGIGGFNFGRMNPKAALAMLKGQMGMSTDVIASMEAMGHRVAGKRYPQDRQILKG
jgi:hypothetical protein